MMKKILVMMLLLTLTLTCVTGCGNGGSADEASFASKIYAAKNPYIENTTADNELIKLLGLNKYGKYTLDVQDGAEPYTLNIRFMYLNSDVDLATMDSTMVCSAALLLSMIGDCGQVAWSYPGEDGAAVGGGVTTEYINETYGTDVKAAADDEAAFEELCNKFFPDKAAAESSEGE